MQRLYAPTLCFCLRIICFPTTLCRRWIWIQFPWLVLHCVKAVTESGAGSTAIVKKTSQPYWTRKRVGDDPVVLADPLPTKQLLQVGAMSCAVWGQRALRYCYWRSGLLFLKK